MAKSKFAGLKPNLGAENEALEDAIEVVAEPVPVAPKTTKTPKTQSKTRTTKKPGTSAKSTSTPKGAKAPTVDPLAPPKKVTRRGHADYIAVTRYLDRQIMLRLNAVEDKFRLTDNRDINQSQLIDEILAAWLAMWDGEDPTECFERSKQRIDRYPDLN
ncbi:hypothetical protein Pse7367_3658 (plasmid) [Thalassoporum mexicanum PCC 7367]|uniref:hypothetical protein n=1 Tax=Thalassoporum mexicanum TaxID=3457544 RepID=UPI00029F8A89|nr:hypothetical protein [Pseudanabaena sp. PCC 7367]AFY71891.1 hypothetical protein Pse7367_3658 [Pseudanabaena sp. PCC 7367]